MAFREYDPSATPQQAVRVIRVEDGIAVKRLSLPFSQLEWTADSRGLIYSRESGGAENLWMQPLDGGAPKKLTNFMEDSIFDFDLSPDGKRFVISRGTVVDDVVLIKDVR